MKKGNSFRSIIVILLFLSTIINLWVNSLYYDIHSKYTNKNAIPGIVLNHLRDVMTKDKKEYFGDYFLQTDGTNSINNNYQKSNEKTFDQDVSDTDTKFVYSKKDYNKQKIYNLDKNLKVIKIFDMNDAEYSITTVEQKTVTKELNKLVQPLLKRADVQEPLINLQWLYDFIFKN